MKRSSSSADLPAPVVLPSRVQERPLTRRCSSSCGGLRGLVFGSRGKLSQSPGTHPSELCGSRQREDVSGYVRRVGVLLLANRLRYSTQHLTGARVLADQHPLQMRWCYLAVESERGAASSEPTARSLNRVCVVATHAVRFARVQAPRCLYLRLDVVHDLCRSVGCLAAPDSKWRHRSLSSVLRHVFVTRSARGLVRVR